MINYTTAYASLYTTASGNAGVLALLGGASSVFLRDELNRTAGKVLPWLVWSYETVGGARGEMRELNAAWWAYVAPNGSARTLYDIAAALDTAYADVLSIAWGRVGVGSLGAPFVDKAMNDLQGLRIPITYRRLG